MKDQGQKEESKITIWNLTVYLRRTKFCDFNSNKNYSNKNDWNKNDWNKNDLNKNDSNKNDSNKNDSTKKDSNKNDSNQSSGANMQSSFFIFRQVLRDF
jgi:hypothetical protein